MAYVEYMDLAVRCSRKAVKLNHSLTHSMSLAFVSGIHQWPVSSPHQGSVTQKMFPFDDIITSVDSWTYLYILFGVAIPLLAVGQSSDISSTGKITVNNIETFWQIQSTTKNTAQYLNLKIWYTWWPHHPGLSHLIYWSLNKMPDTLQTTLSINFLEIIVLNINSLGPGKS